MFAGLKRAFSLLLVMTLVLSALPAAGLAAAIAEEALPTEAGGPSPPGNGQSSKRTRPCPR